MLFRGSSGRFSFFFSLFFEPQPPISSQPPPTSFLSLRVMSARLAVPLAPSPDVLLPPSAATPSPQPPTATTAGAPPAPAPAPAPAAFPKRIALPADVRPSAQPACRLLRCSSMRAAACCLGDGSSAHLTPLLPLCFPSLPLLCPSLSARLVHCGRVEFRLSRRRIRRAHRAAATQGRKFHSRHQ